MAVKIDDLLFTSSEKLKQKEIFHYTSVESLFKIIESKSIRLSSSKYLNDYKELKVLRELIDKEVLDKRAISYNQDRINDLNQLLIENDNLESFIMSFSKHRDLLSQWRGYADNSKGVSIGFDVENLRSKLIELRPKSRFASDVSKMFMKPVIYSLKEQYNELRINESIKKKEGFVSILSKSFWINSLASLYKSESFKEEDEVRILYIPQIEISDEQLSVSGPLVKMKYLHNNGYLKPFFEIEFDSLINVISSITIGANSKLSISELKRYLVNKGLSAKNISVKKSNLTYKID